jgi:hypothetical protein
MKKIIEMDVKVPMTPNFISVGDKTLPIADFTDEELRVIALEWGAELIKKAKVRRRQR